MSDAKIVSINSTKSKKQKEQKATKGDLIIEASAALHPCCTFQGINLKRNGMDVRLMELSNGARRWVRVTADKVVSLIDEEAIANKLASLLFFVFPNDYNLSSKDVREIIAVAAQLAESRDNASDEASVIMDADIKPVLFKSQPGWTWHRIPYDPDESDAAAAEYWETEVFPRFKKNKDGFLAWCGSLFDDNSPRVLCPWLFGEGSSGKGTLAMFIMESMGPAGTTVDAEHLAFNRFGLEILEGKRFAFIDEAPAKTPTSAKFKRLTGERVQMVDRKGQKALPMRIDAKFMYASNQFPHIKAGKEFARRIMPVPFEAIDGIPNRNKQEVIGMMHKFAPYFWAQALNAYEWNKELLDYDKSDIEEFQEDENEIIDLWIQKNIKIGVSSFFPVRYAVEGASLDKIDYYNLRKRLTEFYKVKCGPRKINEASVKCFLNCQWMGKTGVPFEFGFGSKNDEIEF